MIHIGEKIIAKIHNLHDNKSEIYWFFKNEIRHKRFIPYLRFHIDQFFDVVNI
jgi:hypothetical protein